MQMILIGKTRAGRKIHKWADHFPDSDLGDNRVVHAWDCGNSIKVGNMIQVEMPPEGDIEDLCKKCFWAEHDRILQKRAREFKAQMQGRTCQTCIGYIKPRWDCPDCGGTGKSSKPKATPVV